MTNSGGRKGGEKLKLRQYALPASLRATRHPWQRMVDVAACWLGIMLLVGDWRCSRAESQLGSPVCGMIEHHVVR